MEWIMNLAGILASTGAAALVLFVGIPPLSKREQDLTSAMIVISWLMLFAAAVLIIEVGGVC